MPVVAAGTYLAGLVADAADLSAGRTRAVGMVVIFGVVFLFFTVSSEVRSTRARIVVWIGSLALLAAPIVTLYALGYRWQEW